MHGMNSEKERDEEIEMEVFAARYPKEHLKTVKAIATDADRTRGSVLREALRKYLERRKK